MAAGNTKTIKVHYTRQCSRILSDEESGDEADRSEEGFGELVVAGGEAAKLFELVEESLDAVATAVAFLVVRWFSAARAHRWNHRLDPIASEAFSDAISVVTFVERGKLQHVVGVEAFVEGFKLPTVMGLAGGQVERDRAIFVEGGGVDFRAPAPARAAQSLVAAVFFCAPAACGCARTVVESKSRPRAPAKDSAGRFFHKRAQTPRASQRRKRM